MKYLKKFNLHAEYLTYINSDNKILPNVSYCEDFEDIHYNPWIDLRLIAKFNVQDDSETTMIYGGMNYDNISALDYFTKIEVDGVEISLTDLDENDGNYQLSEGEHTIRYTLFDTQEIGHAAFVQCSCLTSIIIPDSVTSIGACAFSECVSLTSITIPDGVTGIGDNAFEGCTGLTSITIPNNVTTIGGYAFSYCIGLTSVTIPDNVTDIGESAFNHCTGLTDITIPDSVTTIGSGAFAGCTSLTSIVVDSANNVYDSRNSCNAIIETATNTLIAGCQNTTIPNTVTTISVHAFNGCTGLTSITIPNSVTSIGNCAFTSCTGLTSITISNGVTLIGNYVFSGCTSLTSITIGSSVTSIGDNAFRNCSVLNNIISLATTAPTIQRYTFHTVKTGGTLTVPSGSTGYNTWMGTGDYYLGKYNWTKIEQ